MNLSYATMSLNLYILSIQGDKSSAHVDLENTT